MASKEKSAGPAHPPYSKMVRGVMAILKDRKGSSLPAIKKCMCVTYSLQPNKKFNTSVTKAVKTALKNGVLVHPGNEANIGANGKFKLTEKVSKPEKKVVPKVKKAAVKSKPAAPKKVVKKKSPKKKAPVKAAQKKKTSTKKTPAKKPAAKKPVAKKPAAKKTTKKPVAKKTPKKAKK